MQIKKLDKIPNQLLSIVLSIENPPNELYYVGNLELLRKRMISIVGTRRPMNYTKEITAKLAKELSKRDICIVSGGAMGVDAIAHKNAYPNTIAVMANSLEYFYPKINENMLKNIYQNSLAISEYEKDFKARPYTFVHRNRLVVGLGEALIVTEADENSGSLKSVEFAMQQGKKIYILSHRIGESLGTQNLINKYENLEIIYDISTFISQFENSITPTKNDNSDEILKFCANNPSYEEALKKFGSKIYEYELEGKIEIKNLKVFVV